MRPAYADGIRLLAVSDVVTDDVVTDVVIVTDVANVMGARADGWWRDRAGAALRLCREIAALAARGIPADRLPSPAKTAAPLTGELFPAYVLVLEGRARDAAGRVDFPHPGVRIAEAPGSGDDSIAAEAAAAVTAGASCLVVTADRELRARCQSVGATIAGPGWLLGLL
jgi:8-oxo-dGTP diphosphatase